MTQHSEPKGLPPMRIGEVVLRTARFEPMNRCLANDAGYQPLSGERAVRVPPPA
jgi:hypothetical protein